MRLTWDPEKSRLNLRDRKFDFAFASLIFEAPTVERVDNRHDYGEIRVVAIGLADGVPLTVVYTDRAEGDDTVRRIISARVSNRRERKTYRQVIG